MTTLTVGIAFGTRPEAIKVAPVKTALEARGIRVVLINSGQHRELLRPILDTFGLEPDFNLDVLVDKQPLSSLTANLANQLGNAIRQSQLNYILVQGDTTTAFIAALAGFYEQLRIGHIEAGLRTRERYSPFPEEINRRLISVLATDHFAPTDQARMNLLADGCSSDTILVTGNTVVDALKHVDTRYAATMANRVGELGVSVHSKYILMTTHRRENLGQPMHTALTAVRKFLRDNSNIELVLPMHRNPGARNAVVEILGQEKNVRLIEAQDYLTFVSLMKYASCILTDSGGIQEEAPYFGKRTIVLRESTERPEGVESGHSRLVGTNPALILEALGEELCAPENSAGTVSNHNPFGDGYASERIADHISNTASQQ